MGVLRTRDLGFARRAPRPGGNSCRWLRDRHADRPRRGRAHGTVLLLPHRLRPAVRRGWSRSALDPRSVAPRWSTLPPCLGPSLPLLCLSRKRPTMRRGPSEARPAWNPFCLYHSWPCTRGALYLAPEIASRPHCGPLGRMAGASGAWQALDAEGASWGCFHRRCGPLGCAEQP